MMNQELYLYLHFPFCSKKCNYCDFYSITELTNIDNFFGALNIELEQYSELISCSTIKTIYIGGGSPNLIPPNLLDTFLQNLRNYNSLNDVEEFTIEINPGEISIEKLQEFRLLGVNRVSIGSQSFDDKELQFLGRIHKSQDILHTIENIKKVRIDNFSLDLIFGAPGQTMASWQNSLVKAFSSGATHFSFYNLIYEPGTPLTVARNQKKFEILDEDLEYLMYSHAHDFLAKNGFEHYEISNWSLPGKKSLHNSAYWIGKNYLGLGPAAHSYINGKRWGNMRSVHQYITNTQKIVDFEEILDKNDKIEEALLLGLRTKEGLNILQFEKLSGKDFGKVLEKLNNKFNNLFIPKYADLNGDFLQLTVEGWFICDYIIEQILLIIE